MYKTIRKIKQRGKESQYLLSQSWKSNTFIGNNREKSNIALGIILTWKKYKVRQKLFLYFGCTNNICIPGCVSYFKGAYWIGKFKF